MEFDLTSAESESAESMSMVLPPSKGLTLLS